MRRLLHLLCLSAVIWSGPARGHALGAAEGDHWAAWILDPAVVGMLAVTAWLHARGVGRLKCRIGLGGVVRPWRILCFGSGMLALCLALVWPFDALAESLLAAHMVQHIILIVVAPPLLLASGPLPVMMCALPAGARRAVAGAMRHPRWRALWRWMSTPLVATLLHGVALWVWHAPAAFEAAYDRLLLHAAEHASFFGTGLLFWWAVLRSVRGGGFGFGAGLLCILVTLIHSGLLGILLTFAPTPLYDLDPQAPASWGLSPLEDQQLAGLIMWIPAGTLYLVVAIALVAAWLTALERRQRRVGAPPAYRP